MGQGIRPTSVSPVTRTSASIPTNGRLAKIRMSADEIEDVVPAGIIVSGNRDHADLRAVPAEDEGDRHQRCHQSRDCNSSHCREIPDCNQLSERNSSLPNAVL